MLFQEEQKQDKAYLLLELEAWQNIIHSDDWRFFLRLMIQHKEYLQSSSNGFLRNHEDRKACEELAKLDDCNKIVSLVSTRIEELRKQIGVN